MHKHLTALMFAALLAVSAGACSKSTTPSDTSAAATGDGFEAHLDPDEVGAFRIVSPAFAAASTIPAKYTCDGQDVSPPIQWNALPDATQSLAIVMVDPDADAPGGFTHWVLANLDPPGGGVGEATTEGVPGPNDAGTTGWTGPCPPSGTHNYVFTVYAFDHATDFGGSPTRAAVEAEPGVKGTATLTGTYR